MMQNTKNSIAEGIKDFKVFVRDAKEITRELTTPLPAKPFIIQYGDLRLDQASGLCTYKKIQYKPRKGGLPYLILNELILAQGHPVSYTKLVSAIQKVKGVKYIVTKNQISSAIRDMRQKFGVNSVKHQEDDIFLATGDGFRLTPR